MTKSIHIKALDTLFFRDGKPFSMGEETWGETVFPPLPSVLYGALRSAYMFQKGISANDILENTEGYTISNIYLEIDGERQFPMPLDLFKFENNKDVHFLERLDSKNDNSSSSATSLLAIPQYLEKKKSEDFGNFGIVKQDCLENYLLKKDIEDIKLDSLKNYITIEPKIGMGRDDSIRTTVGEASGMIYRVGLQRLEKWSQTSKITLVVEFDGLDDMDANGILRLGGEGKTASYTIKNDLVRLPSLTTDLPNKLKIYLSTPSIFKNGWCPEWLLNGNLNGISVELETCAIGKPLFVGGFDIKKQRPKAMYKAVPAGSVYYVNTENPIELYQALSNKVSLSENISDSEWYDDFTIQGFGKFFIGLV